MPKEKKATNAAEEKEVRTEIDYDNTVKDYTEKKEAVEAAVDMIQTPFWKLGFKNRRDAYDKTHKKLVDVVQENGGEDYDSAEYVKALNKTKLDFSKAVNDFDNFVADVQKVVDVLHIYTSDEDLPLFKDLVMMTATFSRKTGKISMKKVK